MPHSPSKQREALLTSQLPCLSSGILAASERLGLPADSLAAIVVDRSDETGHAFADEQGLSAGHAETSSIAVAVLPRWKWAAIVESLGFSFAAVKTPPPGQVAVLVLWSGANVFYLEPQQSSYLDLIQARGAN